MMFPLQLQQFETGGQKLWLYVPDPAAVEHAYRERQGSDPTAPFPYWAQVWPAALAMGAYIAANRDWIKGKQVLELAAGLGLPSLLAARWARAVCCSDYLPEAVEVQRASAARNGLRNIECRQLDWHHLPQVLDPDLLMLSDINYDPLEFETLYRVLTGFLEKGTAIVLSTPQRLMAKPFVERLLPWCVEQLEIAVPHQGGVVPISVFRLQP